jgi:hypothetical protein
MSGKLIGGCLCGAARFEVSGSFDGFFLCHCSRCRKDTGSAHAANMFLSMAKIAWLTGRETIKTYCVPGTRHMRSFCTECGSALPSVQMNGRVVVVPAGCVDSEIDIQPTAHICFASRASWDEHLEDIPKFDGLPG